MVKVDSNEHLPTLEDIIDAFNVVEDARLTYEQLKKQITVLSSQIEEKNKLLAQQVNEIKELKNRLSNIIDSIYDGLIAVDITGQIVMFNKRAKEILDIQNVPSNISEKVPSYIIPLFEVIKEVLKTQKEVIDRQLRLLINDKEIYIILSTSIVYDYNGKFWGVVQSFRDQTQLVNIQEALKRKEKLSALGQMAAGVAHEIRNPLAAIQLYARLIEQELAEKGMDTTTISKVITGVSRVDRIIRDMLSFTRPQEPIKRTTNLKDIIYRAQEMVKTLERKEIKFFISNSDVEICVDPDQMERVFINLFLNASQVMKDGQGIYVEVKREKEGVRIKVEDEGPGIPEEMLPRIFDPFFSTKNKGTGLGLTIVYNIITIHGGDICVKNGDKGAIFEFFLPER